MIPASFWRDLAVAEIEPAQQEMYIKNAEIAEKHEIMQERAKEDDTGLRHAALHFAIQAHPGGNDDYLVSAAGNYLQFLKGNDKDFHDRMTAMGKVSGAISDKPV